MIETNTLLIYIASIYTILKVLSSVFRSYKYSITDPTLLNCVQNNVRNSKWSGSSQILSFFPLTTIQWSGSNASFVFYVPWGHASSIQYWARELMRAPYDMDEILSDIYWAQLESRAGSFPSNQELIMGDDSGTTNISTTNVSKVSKVSKYAIPAVDPIVSKPSILYGLAHYWVTGELPADFLSSTKPTKTPDASCFNQTPIRFKPYRQYGEVTNQDIMRGVKAFTARRTQNPITQNPIINPCASITVTDVIDDFEPIFVEEEE